MRNSEKLLIKEITKIGEHLQWMLRDLSIGQIIEMFRKQLGMSQKDLSSRAKIPQPTLSRIEKNKQIPNIHTLRKIFEAMSCTLVLVPVLEVSIEEQRNRQAESIAKKNVRYLQGTMSLEAQEPDSEFVNELIKEEKEGLLRSKKLWRK